MGRLSLLLVAASVVGSAILFQGIQQTVHQGERKLDDYASKAMARTIAQTGLAEAEHAYYTDFSLHGNYLGPAELSGIYQGGRYSARVNTSGPITSLKVVGTYGEANYTIERLFDESSASGLPPFMTSAVTCARDVSVTASMHITAAHADENANISANRQIRILQPSTVEGFAFHGDALNIYADTPEEIFRPNSNSSGAPVAQPMSPVDIPEFDAAQHRSLATVTSPTHVSLSGPVSLGSLEEPMIWYIGGNLTFAGPVVFSGYGVLLVDGDVHIHNSISFEDEASRSKLGLYANDNIHVNAPNLKLGGQWFTNRSFVFNHDVNFTGSLTSRGGDCIFNQPITISYVAPSDELASPIWGSSKELKLLRSREW